jgi:ribosomal protein S27AE
MKPFDPAATCVKCGGDDISTHYEEEKLCSRCGPLSDHSNPERLSRHCGRCGYDWYEKPLGARGERA